MVIALLAVPILIQVYFNSGLAYLLNRVTGEQHCVAGPSALIGASNFFELAVAAAIKFTLLTRDVSAYLTDRYSERKESAEALMERVNLSAAT